MKKTLCALLVIISVLHLSACGIGALTFVALSEAGNDAAEKADIKAFVLENKDKLTECINANNVLSFNDVGVVKKVTVKSNAVDFYCGGKGFGSATFYCGFYYSPSDCMLSVNGMLPNGTKLTPKGNGYGWQEQGGDNTYYTEKICTGFYYYEEAY